MQVTSILICDKKDFAISRHWVLLQWTSFTTEVTREWSKPHFVSNSSKYCHSTPVPMQISSSCPSISKIQNHSPGVVCAKISCTSRKHSSVPWPSRWMPADCTPSIRWCFLSPKASRGFDRLPPDDPQVVTIVNLFFCCCRFWYCCCGWSLSKFGGRAAGSISCPND